MRSVLIAVAFIGCAVPAFAQTPDLEDKRFTFHKVDDGFLRLDGRTGAVSLCRRPESGWVCGAVPDERAALENEIARLANENASRGHCLIAAGLCLAYRRARPRTLA